MEKPLFLGELQKMQSLSCLVVTKNSWTSRHIFALGSTISHIITGHRPSPQYDTIDDEAKFEKLYWKGDLANLDPRLGGEVVWNFLGGRYEFTGKVVNDLRGLEKLLWTSTGRILSSAIRWIADCSWFHYGYSHTSKCYQSQTLRFECRVIWAMRKGLGMDLKGIFRSCLNIWSLKFSKEEATCVIGEPQVYLDRDQWMVGKEAAMGES